jgi:hypothetical protein
MNVPRRRGLLLLFACASLSLPSRGFAQSVSHGHYYAGALLCDDGYKDVGGQCRALPGVTNGHYYMATLLCDDGYKDVGGQCRALPGVTNGHYYMATLLCDDGYKDVGGQCRALPGVTNGHYYMATLLCDDGYKNTGGRCTGLLAVSNAHYYGAILMCDDGFAYKEAKCIRADGARVEYRVSAEILQRSRAAPVPSFDQFSDYARVTSTSGHTFDARSGNQYNWTRSPSGETTVRGMNVQTGSIWRTTIQPDGSMRGMDKDMNPWSYNSRSGTYINYGSGKMCFGKGASRTCF